MSIIRNNTVIMWKEFAFPMSIETFQIKEEAKVATYEYAGRNGAEQERVLAYRIFSISGRFTLDSGDKDPSYYAQKLRQLNDNFPGVLAHPIFGTYKCICKGLTMTNEGNELESAPGIDQSITSVPNLSGGGAPTFKRSIQEQSLKVASRQRAVPNYKFTIEFWETTPPNSASLQSQLSKLFPATSVKPTSDNYQTSSKYRTVTELYWALVNGQIAPGTDPIRNSEWLAYDYNFRKEAYDMWILDPKGVKHGAVVSSTKLSVPNAKNNHTVPQGGTVLSVAKYLNTTPEKLFQANVGKQVRYFTDTDPFGAFKDKKYWKKPSELYPGDVITIPGSDFVKGLIEGATGLTL